MRCRRRAVGARRQDVAGAYRRPVFRWLQRRASRRARLEDGRGTASAVPGRRQVRATETEDSKRFWDAHVEGILAFARKPSPARRRQEQLLAEAPLALATAPPFHVEVLDWESVAAWVAPSRYTPPRTPSPLPHLPSSWEELTDAYLEVVGVRSEDCYGVQATRAGTKSDVLRARLPAYRAAERAAARSSAAARGGAELRTGTRPAGSRRGLSSTRAELRRRPRKPPALPTRDEVLHARVSPSAHPRG